MAEPGTSYDSRLVADFADGTTLDHGVVGAGTGGGDGTMATAAASSMSMAAAAGGSPRVTRQGTATQADAKIEVAKLYRNAPNEAAKVNGVFVALRDVVVVGRDTVRGGNVIHTVVSTGQVDAVPNVRQRDTGVHLAGGGAADAENMLRKMAGSNRSPVQDLGGGQLTTTLQDGTILTSQPDGTWGKLTFERPAKRKT